MTITHAIKMIERITQCAVNAINVIDVFCSCYTFIKPGAPGLITVHNSLNNFLKLFWHEQQYVSVCVSVRPIPKE